MPLSHFDEFKCNCEIELCASTSLSSGPTLAEKGISIFSIGHWLNNERPQIHSCIQHTESPTGKPFAIPVE